MKQDVAKSGAQSGANTFDLAAALREAAIAALLMLGLATPIVLLRAGLGDVLLHGVTPSRLRAGPKCPRA